MHLFLKTCMSTDGEETDRVKHACPQTGWGYNDRSIVYGIRDNTIKGIESVTSNMCLHLQGSRKQEAHGPHRSPEKLTHDYIITLIKRRKKFLS